MAAKNQISRIQHRRGLQIGLTGIVLNTGELGWTADERRIFVGNRTSEDGPVDENVEIVTEYSTIDAANVSKTLTVSSLSIIGADTTIETFDSTTDDTLIISYKLTQGAIRRMGTVRILSDGTLVTYDDDSLEVGGSTTLVLKAVMSGTDILFQYNATGTAASLSYFVESF